MIKGLEEIEKNIAEQLERIEGLSVKGVRKAAGEIVNRSKELTPVDTGDLKNEQFVVNVKGGARIDVRKNYALYVHEDLEAHHEVGQAKFLETAIVEKTDRILELAEQEAKIK